MTRTRSIPDEDPPPYTPTDPLTPSSSNNTSTLGAPAAGSGEDLAPLYSRSVAPPNFVSAAGYFYERPPPPPETLLAYATNDDHNGGSQGEILEHALTIYTRSKAKDYARFPRCWRSRSDEITHHDWATFLRYLFPANLGLASTQQEALPAQVRAEIARDSKDAPQETDEERKDRIAAVVSEWNDCFFVPRGTAVIYCYGSSVAAAPVSPLCPKCYPAASARSMGSTPRSETTQQQTQQKEVQTQPQSQPQPDQQRQQPPAPSRHQTEPAPSSPADTRPQVDRAQTATETPQPGTTTRQPPRSFGLVEAVTSFQHWANFMASQAQQYSERLGEQAVARSRVLEDRAEMFGRMAAQRAQAHGDALQQHGRWLERKYRDMGLQTRGLYQRGSESFASSSTSTAVNSAATAAGLGAATDGSFGGGSGHRWSMSTSSLSLPNARQRHEERKRDSGRHGRRGSVSSVSSISSTSDVSISSLSSDDHGNWDKDVIESFRREIHQLRDRHQEQLQRQLNAYHNNNNRKNKNKFMNYEGIDEDAARLRQELFALRDAHRHLRAASGGCGSSRGGGGGGGCGSGNKSKPSREQKRAVRQEMRDAQREYRAIARQVHAEMKKARQAQRQRRKDERRAKREARKGKAKEVPTSADMGLGGDAAARSRAQVRRVNADPLGELETGIVQLDINDNHDSQKTQESEPGPSSSSYRGLTTARPRWSISHPPGATPPVPPGSSLAHHPFRPRFPFSPAGPAAPAPATASSPMPPPQPEFSTSPVPPAPPIPFGAPGTPNKVLPFPALRGILAPAMQTPEMGAGPDYGGRRGFGRGRGAGRGWGRGRGRGPGRGCPRGGGA